jgi:hypothetical protein
MTWPLTADGLSSRTSPPSWRKLYAGASRVPYAAAVIWRTRPAAAARERRASVVPPKTLSRSSATGCAPSSSGTLTMGVGTTPRRRSIDANILRATFKATGCQMPPRERGKGGPGDRRLYQRHPVRRRRTGFDVHAKGRVSLSRTSCITEGDAKVVAIKMHPSWQDALRRVHARRAGTRNVPALRVTVTRATARPNITRRSRAWSARGTSFAISVRAAGLVVTGRTAGATSDITTMPSISHHRHKYTHHSLEATHGSTLARLRKLSSTSSPYRYAG